MVINILSNRETPPPLSAKCSRVRLDETTVKGLNNFHPHDCRTEMPVKYIRTSFFEAKFIFQ